MIGTFETVLNALGRRNHLATVVEASTGNLYRVRALLSSLQVSSADPRSNPGLRFAEVEYRDEVYEGTQGFISWIVPGTNPGQRKLLYTVQTVQTWINSQKQYWVPDWVNTLRQ